MKISISLHRFLESIIKPDSFNKNGRWAYRILERGYITEWELSIVKNMGYKF